MSFEWRTDEDDGWQEPAKRKETAVPQSFLRRRWRFLLMVLVGIAAVWGVVQWQINQRVAAATVAVETELLNTHNFVLRTAVDQDEDLFRSNLSGRDPAWGELQKTLLNEGLLLDRPMLGWHHEAMPGELTLEEVSISVEPTLDAAELLYPQEYAVQVPSGVTETVTLQHTAVYRLGERRWLYSPPLNDFWGDWFTQGGDYLTVAYPERDREVATRLAIHLDQLVDQMCADLADLNCAGDLRLHLRLDINPESLLAMNEIENVLRAGLRLELPTPTLIGLPTDDAGYEVLYRAYAVQLATAVLAHQIEYDCCRHELFFRALRDYQLVQLDLQPWPLTEEMYSDMLTAGFDGDGAQHWTRRWEAAPPQFLQVWVVEDPDPIWQQVYALIEYLNLQETAVSPTQMMRLMERSSYQDWLADVLPVDYDANLFATHFLEYIYQQTAAAQQTEPPIPLPNGTITLICHDGEFDQDTSVFQYDLALGEWREHLRFSKPDSSINIHSVDGKRFLVSEYQYTTQTSETAVSLITPDEEILLEEMHVTEQPNNYNYLNYWFTDKDGDYFMRVLYEDRGLDAIFLMATDCPTADCPAQPLPGWPALSPDKQHLLALAFPRDGSGVIVQAELQAEIFVGATLNPALESVGQGGYPFWLDNKTFGYWRNGEAGLELVTAVLPNNTVHVLLNEASLLSEIPAEEQPTSVFPGRVMANPINPQELLLQITNDRVSGTGGQSYLFKLSLSADLAGVTSLEMLPQGSIPADTIGYSPDGRYILLINYPTNGRDATIFLLDSVTEQLEGPLKTGGFYFPWSADGQWFLQNSRTFLLLLAPAYNYQHFIPHGLENCHQTILSVDE